MQALQEVRLAGARRAGDVAVHAPLQQAIAAVVDLGDDLAERASLVDIQSETVRGFCQCTFCTATSSSGL